MPPFPFQAHDSPWMGLPGPTPSPQGPVGPGGPPASLFPTDGLKPGDVVSVIGPFQGLHQGAVRVKFNGAPWAAPAMTGPYSASVVVPGGARTGECAVEVNGRRVFGRQCSVSGESRYYGQEARPRERRGYETWTNYGDGMGSYVTTYDSRGAGAVAADDGALGDADLVARSRPGLVPRGYSQPRVGVQIDPVTRRVVAVATTPSRLGAATKAPVTLTARPASFLHAGTLRGSPDPDFTATMRPGPVVVAGPTVADAAAARWAARDAAAEADRADAELEVPPASPSPWRAIGLAAAIAAAVYLLTKRR